MATIEIQCVVPGCDFPTGQKPQEIAIALLGNHTSIHLVQPAYPDQLLHAEGQNWTGPGSMWESQRNNGIFSRRWVAFALGSGIDPHNSSSQLFQCAADELGNGLLKSYPGIIIKPTDELMAATKAMAVIAVATGVNLAELVLQRQERDEPFRSFTARVRCKPETCAYSVQCACPVPTDVDFTEIIVRDVLIAGIADMDIRREILVTDKILERTVNDVITLVEMARNNLPSSAAGPSSFKRITTTSVPASVSSRPGRGQTTICP